MDARPMLLLRAGYDRTLLMGLMRTLGPGPLRVRASSLSLWMDQLTDPGSMVYVRARFSWMQRVTRGPWTIMQDNREQCRVPCQR